MVIESCTSKNNVSLGKNIAKKVFTFTAYSLLIIFGVITTIAVIGQNSQNSPTGTYLSPLPKAEVAQTTPTDTQTTPTTEETPTPPQKSTPELINLAQNYLDKAFEIAKISQQTQEQKDQIIENLDQSLNFTTQAINQEPRNPKGYILRAQILTAVSNQNPSALAQAQKDLETAQNLSQGQPITLPESINPLNLLPDQQALANSDIILAAPEDSTNSTASGEIKSNSFTTQVSLPAGQTELLVEDQRITTDSYIYLIPEGSNNTPVFVKAKGQGQFTLSATTAPVTDLTINYYIITP